MTRGRWPALVAVATALSLLAGCGSQVPGGAGGSAASSANAQVGPPVTLRLADAEAQGRSSQPWIDRFMAKVTTDSGGTITIEPIYKAGGGNVDKPGEVIVASQVIAGDVELALVPVRAWNDVGVTSLQALAAPLLIDSDALLTGVAADPLVEPLLDGMVEHGVVGLSAWPDDLRHPFAWEQNGPPFLRASDMKGAKVWTFQSKLQSMILEGLGATPVNATTVEIDAMVAAGSLRGAESSFNGIVSLSGTPTGTGDVALFAKYQVLAAEDAAFSRLTPAQQVIIRDAAKAARDLAIKDHVPDADIARKWCKRGGRVVLAGAPNLATFQKAAEPILAKLAEDPTTAAAIEAIRALKAHVPVTAATACEPAPDPDAPWPSVAPGPDLGPIPDGVYVHTTLSSAEMVAAGVGAEDAKNNSGEFTLTVTGNQGSWVLHHATGGLGQDETFPLVFTAIGDRIRFQQAGDFYDFRWRLESDILHLEIVGSNLPQRIFLEALFGGDWAKVE